MDKSSIPNYCCMLKLFSLPGRGRRWFYPVLSVFVALGITLSSMPSQAISVFDLLRQGVQIFQLSNISERQEVEIGKQIDQQIKREIKIYRNQDINSYVQQIGRQLAATSDRPNLPYTFQVVDDKGVNAFATAGGFVYVNTGLLKLADNEAEFASVMAHEIGHITGKHLVEQMRESALAQGVSQAAGLDRNAAVQIGVDLALRRPNSRKDELEADQIGLRNLRRAGYAESGMVSFMRKLLKSRSTPTFLSTHPATGDRIVALERAINPQKSNVGNGLDSNAYKSQIRSLS